MPDFLAFFIIWAGFPIAPRLPTELVRFASGEEVRSRTLLPDAVSQSDIWSILPRVASVRPSALKPTSAELVATANERNSRPDFTSQSLIGFSLFADRGKVAGFCRCSSSGP